jgi:hypothetical protein
MIKRSDNVNTLKAVHTDISREDNIIRVVKSEKINEYDENTYARVCDLHFHDGVIEVDMLSRLLPDAPDFARGFIGIAFRINEDDTQFESFYIRPTNSVNMTDDHVRIAHGCQYFSYPKYTFAYFRENNITKYEASIHNELDQWVHLKAVIKGAHASFYLNNEDTPTLEVNDMFHGKEATGDIGFFVDIGTEGFFKNLCVNNKRIDLS